MAQPIAHGGGLIAARRRFPAAAGPWIDLSTGINPVPYETVLRPESLTRLPEPEEVAGLEATAARAYGVADPAIVAAAPGTQSLIQLLPRLWPGRRVAVLSPTYAEHAAAWALTGSVRTVPDLAAIGDAEIVVVGHPNNPDGALQDRRDLLALAARLACCGGVLVVDEAFADLEACSLADALPHPGLLLLRSFGKTYGLAGARLGFALTRPDWAALLRQALGPWAVSGPALAAGQMALADTAWRIAAADRLTRDVARLDGLLTAAGGLVLGGTLLFRLTAWPAAAAMFERLGRAGILVRRFDSHPDWLRWGLPEPGAWVRLEAATAPIATGPRCGPARRAAQHSPIGPRPDQSAATAAPRR